MGLAYYRAKGETGKGSVEGRGKIFSLSAHSLGFHLPNQNSETVKGAGR